MQRFFSRYRLLTPLCTLALLAGADPAQAIDYGIFDSRALAMGGTAVAIGTTSQAQYYNPALLSFHDGDEDKTRDGRVYFPTIVVQAAKVIEPTADAVDDELDIRLSDAVNAFNTNPGTLTAQSVASSAHELRRILDKIANKDLTVDAFVGLSVSEPSDREGGAFYVGARAIGAGTSSISKEDLALLDDYISAMDQLAQGTPPLEVALQHPDLIGADGKLKDPTTALNSSADIGALVIGEWGLSFAKEFTFWDQPVSFGITPKLMRVDAYRETVDFNTNSVNNVSDGTNKFSDTKRTHLALNADAGVAAIIATHYRVSLAIKDVIAKDFRTNQAVDPITGLAGPDLTIKLHPRARLGVGYVNDSFSVGLDYDLKESTPMANEAPSQDISLGAEYRLFNCLALRAGYRQDKTGERANVISGGIGYQWRRFVADISYASSTDIKAGGLQVGWAF